MQQEHVRDGLSVRSLAVVAIPAALLLGAVTWAALLAAPHVEAARCLGFWDDGTKVAITPAARVGACSHFERSPCYPAGFSDQAPVRHVFFADAPLDLLRLAYAPAGGSASGSVERCGPLTSILAREVPGPTQLLTARLKEARVELRHLDGRLENLARVGERYTCGKGRSWCWVGTSTAGGVPVVRAHLVQAARTVITVQKQVDDATLALRFGFTSEGERLRTPLFGFARLRVRSGGRTLYTGIAWPGLGDRGGVVNLASVPAGGSVELVFEGLGSRFGELWVFGRFAP